MTRSLEELETEEIQILQMVNESHDVMSGMARLNILNQMSQFAMYGNTSFDAKKVQEFLDILIEEGFLTHNPDVDRYNITKQGKDVLLD